jgi:ATP-binding cassette subfamily F protein uup
VLELRSRHGVPARADGWHAGSGYAAYLAGRAEREERAEVAEQVRKNLATRELAWLRRGAPARTSKPKARIATATALVEGKAQAAARDGDLGLSMGSKRLGTKGIELTDVGFSWPDGTRVIDPCSLVFEPGDRVGIVGSNGAGKSTLLDLIAAGCTNRRAGRPWCDGADRLLRPTRPRPRPDPTGARAIAGDKGEPSLADVNLMRRFWFDGDAQFAPIGTLSGGERAACNCCSPSSQHQRVAARRTDQRPRSRHAAGDGGLPRRLAGIVVTVSHDRAFLDRVTDELLALDGKGACAGSRRCRRLARRSAMAGRRARCRR